ncbi:MAG: helix-turn-helix domain-containing protein [Conexivisphaerales archaeon]
MNPINLNLKIMVLKLYIEGLSNREIAKRTGISHPTVSKILNEIKSGRSGLVPNDVVSQLEEIAGVVRIKKELGMDDDELHATFVRGLGIRK